jgi:predicted lipoprotein with Yx(FWY)xxD motif
MMAKAAPMLAVGLATVFALSACGGGEAGNSPASAPTTTSAMLKTANSSYGQILVDGSGHTLYLFVADKGTTSTCYQSCATTWPPFDTTGSTQATGGANQSLVGTTKRTDGTTQVTYAGHPLYTFIGDANAGQTTGQALNQSGGLWYVLNPQGQAITKAQ